MLLHSCDTYFQGCSSRQASNPVLSPKSSHTKMLHKFSKVLYKHIHAHTHMNLKKSHD